MYPGEAGLGGGPSQWSGLCVSRQDGRQNEDSALGWPGVLPLLQLSKTGAHLMLQTRMRMLDGTLRTKFQQWYPEMKADGEIRMAA